MHQAAKIQSPQDVLAILWRRKWHVIIPGLVLFAVSAFVVVTWPPTYRSQATILIEEANLVEEANISGDLMDVTTASYADHRVQVLSQRMLSRQNLIKLIEKFGLYPEARANNQLGSAAATLRDSITVAFISAEVNDPRRGPVQVTIAFTLSVYHKDPVMAKTIADELLSLYLAENLRSRQEKASESTEFLAKEAEKLARQITELETKLAAFKLENAGSLPEQVSLNQQAMNRIELQLLELRYQIQSQKERKVYLESQLSQVSPYVSITLDDGSVLRPEERLKMLESEYSKLSYIYGPKHPTMVEISTEIETLKSALGEGSPDKPTNPAYIQLKAELKAISSNLNSLISERTSLSQKFAALEGRTLKAPEIEREYLLITRNYENATAEYRAVKEKLADAERLESLETELKGERFAVIEEPEVPINPISPNRRLLMALGLAISVFGSLVAVGIAEALDQSVSSPRQLAAITGANPLVVIPYIKISPDRGKAWSMSLIVWFGLIAVFVTVLFAVNEFVPRPYELWAKFGLGGAGSI